MRENRKTRIGRVISDKMEKTVVVRVEEAKQHTLYRRTIRQTVKWKAHNPDNTARVGDLVRIIESRPISKDKHWRVVEILQRGDVVDVRPQEIGTQIESPVEEAQP